MSSCIPCPCDFFGITGPFVCDVINKILEIPPRLGQLYTGIFTGIEAIPELVNGAPGIIETNITAWFLELALALILPWIIVFIVLFFLMSHHKLISTGYAIILTIFTIVLGIISLVFIFLNTLYIFTFLTDQVRQQILNNWNANKDTIFFNIFNNYGTCAYCPSDTFGCTTNCGGICQGGCPGQSVDFRLMNSIDEILENYPEYKMDPEQDPTQQSDQIPKLGCGQGPGNFIPLNKKPP